MHPTPYPDINHLLDDLLSRIRAILGDKLVGLYLYGSLVWGDFDHDTSDIDLLAALTSDLDAEQAGALKAMHDDIARTYKAWDDRIEVQYLSLLGLKTFRTQSTPMAVISQSAGVCMFRFEVLVQSRTGFLYSHCLASCKWLLCFLSTGLNIPGHPFSAAEFDSAYSILWSLSTGNHQYLGFAFSHP